MASESGIRIRSVDSGLGLPVTTNDVSSRGAVGVRNRSFSKSNAGSLGSKRWWTQWFHVLRIRAPILSLLFIVLVAGRGLYTGSIMAELRSDPHRSQPAGSVYRSHLAYARFTANMSVASKTSVEEALAWQGLKSDTGWRPCAGEVGLSAPGPRYISNGYIVPVVNGGLNQQRAAICNAVAVAKLLNATLVIPHLYYHAIWKDRSTFEEIFDVQHFIATLSLEIAVARQLPDQYRYLMEDIRLKTKVPAWSPPSYYLSHVLPLLLSQGALRLDPFANRLSYDNVPPSLQRLRCWANFHALRFAPHIAAMADTIVERMSAQSPRGQYLAVHLRFEKDMVAFSNCLYDGGTREREDLAAFREVGWNGKFTRPGRKAIDPGAVRRAGKCPLTPLEVGLILRGMGFPRHTPVYLAAGDIYGGLPPALLEMLPSIHSKETLLTADELAPFKGHSSRLAALDYSVCVAAAVFMATQGGNFPQVVEGHRRYLNRNHWKTVSPDKKVLARLLDNRTAQWQDFAHELRLMREGNDLGGVTERKREQSLYSYPAPECMCREGDSGYGEGTDGEERARVRVRGRTLGLGWEADLQIEQGVDRTNDGLRADKWELTPQKEELREDTDVQQGARGGWEKQGRVQTEDTATTGRGGEAGEGTDEEETEMDETEDLENGEAITEGTETGLARSHGRVGSNRVDDWAVDDRPRLRRRRPIDEP